MLGKIDEFLAMYLNSTNIFIVALSVMLILMVINCITSGVGTRSLKKINKALRDETGDDIIRRIENMKLSKRYAKMWDDYYCAFCSEETVSLNNYLIKADLFVEKQTFVMASRATAVIAFCLAGLAAFKVPGLYEVEKDNVISLFFALGALQAVLEIVYTAVAQGRKKRILRYLDEFEILSLRKLPGKAVDFKQKHVVDKIASLSEKTEEAVLGIKQINARLDRQYRFLENAIVEQEKQEE